MRMLQALALKAICAGLLASGVMLIFKPSSELYRMVATLAPDNGLVRVVVAILIVAVALWALIPFPRRQRGKSISFPDALGQNVIQLNGMERTLARLLARDPEVKWSNVHFEPADDQRRVRICAVVDIFKAASASTREIQARLKDLIAEHGRKLLGDDVIVGVDLNTRNVVINKKAGFDTPSPKEYPAAVSYSGEKKKTGLVPFEPGEMSYLPGESDTDAPAPSKEDEQQAAGEAETLPYGGIYSPEDESGNDDKRPNGS